MRAAAILVARGPGVIQGVCHVDGNAYLRVDRERAGIGAAQADLLLHRGHGEERRLRAPRRHLLQRLGHDERAHLVVERP